MYTMFVLLSLSLPNQITIVVDDLPKSQLLKQDLEYDFNDTHGREVDFELYRYLDYIQDEVKRNSEIIHFTEVTKLTRNKIGSLPRYPAIRVNRYNRIVYYDDVPHERVYHLLYLKYHIDRYYYEHLYDEWQMKCNKILRISNAKYVNDITNYMLSRNFLEDLPFLFPRVGDTVSAYKDNIEIIERAVNKHGKKKGFPVRPPIVYPPEPPDLDILPWSDKYQLTPFPRLTINKTNVWINN